MNEKKESFTDHNQVDLYYESKKTEVKNWLIEYSQNLKRATKEQRRMIVEYANNLTFSNAGEINLYVQTLKTVGKKEKQSLYDYLSQVDWLPEDTNMGVLDGELVTRVLESPLEKLFGDKEWKSKKE